MKWLGLLIAVTLLGAAGAAIASSTSAASAHRCPPASWLPPVPKHVGRQLKVDVNGDGVRDRVSMLAVGSCRYLYAQSKTRRYAVLVTSGWQTLKPTLVAAVRLARNKSQLVVLRDEGAATVSASLYGIPNRQLQLLRFKPASTAFDELLFGGSVDAWSGAACRLGGPLKIIGFGAFGKRPLYSEQVYRLNGRWLRLRRQRSVRSTRPPRWWKRETGKPNFAGCLTAGSSSRLG